MNCICGTTIEKGTTCTSCHKKHQECPSCGGDTFASESTILLACPYCDTPLNKIQSDAPPYFPINFSAEEIAQQLHTFLLNRFGIPEDFSQHHRIIESNLAFVPVRLYSVQAWLNDTICEIDTKAIILSKKLWYFSKITDYRFAVRVKQVMNNDCISQTVHPINVSDEDVDTVLNSFGKKLLAQDQKRFAEVKKETRIESKKEGEVFYPLYEIKYEYDGRSYKAVVDASNGVVCFSEHPMSKKTRAAIFSTGIFMMASTILFCVLFAFFHSAFAPLMMLIIGSVSSLRIFWTSLKSHSGQEAIALDNTMLDIKNLETSMDLSQRKPLLSQPTE